MQKRVYMGVCLHFERGRFPILNVPMDCHVTADLSRYGDGYGHQKPSYFCFVVGSNGILSLLPATWSNEPRQHMALSRLVFAESKSNSASRN